MSEPGTNAFPVLETPRLILRETVLADAEAMFALFSDEEVTRYHDLATFTRMEEAIGVIERRAKRFAGGRGIRWAIARKEDNIFIGSCGFGAWDAVPHQAEIGYELARPWWGQGIMTEALKAILAFGFEQMDFHHILAEVMMENAASMRVLARLGFRNVGVFYKEGFWKGQHHDLQRFVLDRNAFWDKALDPSEHEPPPTEEQRRRLCEMMYRAFIEMRLLGWKGASEQAADLADAFHELPLVMYRQDFSWSFARHFLEHYQNKYPRKVNPGSTYDYVSMLDAIQKSV